MKELYDEEDLINLFREIYRSICPVPQLADLIFDLKVKEDCQQYFRSLKLKQVS